MNKIAYLHLPAILKSDKYNYIITQLSLLHNSVKPIKSRKFRQSIKKTIGHLMFGKNSPPPSTADPKYANIKASTLHLAANDNGKYARRDEVTLSHMFQLNFFVRRKYQHAFSDNQP